MTEIRANREYKFKEFSISEEIPKSPPMKTKRWTFHDPNSSSRFYNRPLQRKWDEKYSGQLNGPSDTNINQQYIKPFKKPESDLRAEFFNAYKKYYRRVDIKRLEVQSTLNVDAKFRGADETLEGESSLYKEKECMEINIVMDTEKDDALVSSKVRRTFLCASPVDELSCGNERSIRPENLIIGEPEDLEIRDQNIVSGETKMDDSGYCSSHDKSNCQLTDVPATSEKKYNSQGNHPCTTSILEQGQYSMDRTFHPFSKMSQSNKNIGFESEKNSSQSYEKTSTLNQERFTPYSCNGFQKTDSVATNQGSNVSLPVPQMTDGNNLKVTGLDQLIQRDEKNGDVKSAEITFYNSKLKMNAKDPVYRISFKCRNPEEKSSTSELFDNRNPKFKRSIGSGYNDSEDVAGGFLGDKDNSASLLFDNSRPNLFNHDSAISSNVENSINIDLNSKNRPNSEPEQILTVREPLRKYHTNDPASNEYYFKEGITESTNRIEKNVNNTVGVFGIESPNEPPRSLKETQHDVSLTSEDDFSNNNSGVRFRGLRGAVFNDPNKKNLKSLVINVIQNDDKKVTKLNSFPLNEQTNLTQRFNKNKGYSNLERKYVNTSSQKSSKTNAGCLKSFQISYCDPVDPSYKKKEVPAMFQNIKPRSRSPTHSKDQCTGGRLLITAKRDNIEEPFVIWSNKNKTDPTESLQINKLTMSDNYSDIESDYDNNSEQQSFSDCYSVREISDNSKTNHKIDIQDHQNYSQSSENRTEKTEIRKISKTSYENEEQENLNDEKGMQFPERRYSNMSSVPSENCAFPKHRFQVEGSRVLDNCAKVNRKSQIRQERVTDLSDNKGGSMDERSGVVSQRQYKEEPFDKRGSQQKSIQITVTNGCSDGESQLNGRIAKEFNKNKRTDESNRIPNGQIGGGGQKGIMKQVPEECAIEHSKTNFYESNGCDKKISKSSSSDILQIGPTYTVHYSPVHKNVLRNDQEKKYDDTWEREEVGERRCNGGQANTPHCSHGDVTDCIRRKRNETLSRNCRGNSPPVCCDNYLNTCHDMICHAYYKSNSDMKSCGYLSAGNNNCCDCEGLNRGFSHRMVKNNEFCQCQARVTDLHCRNMYNCPICNKHCNHGSCPCQEGNKNFCQKCGDEQIRFLFKECSANFQNPNNPYCSCPRCSTDIRIEAACKRRGKCCNSCSDDEQINSCPLRLDRERQWMTTGHQPKRNINKCQVDANIERFEESSASCVSPNNEASQPLMREFGSCHPENSLYYGDRHYAQDRSPTDNHRMNNSHSYDKEFKNVCNFESAENCSVRNRSLRGIKTGREHLNTPVDRERINFNIAGWVDDFANQDKLEGRAAKLIPDKKVHDVLETKRISSEGKMFCMAEQVGSCDNKTNSAEGPLKESDEPLFLCEEQWDTDDGWPMRRVVRKIDERKEENGEGSGSDSEPIYLREENWGSGDEETGPDQFLWRDSRLKSIRYRNGIKYPSRKGQRSIESQPVGRGGNLSEGEESRICSSVHAVSDPSFQCEEQWASDEEKCQDHKFQLTLPKNTPKMRKGPRRSFNPKRWDMVTDLPRNEYIARQNRKNMERNNYECRNFGDSMIFQNSRYFSNNEQ